MVLTLVSTSASDVGFIYPLCVELSRHKFNFRILLTGQHALADCSNYPQFTARFIDDISLSSHIVFDQSPQKYRFSNEASAVIDNITSLIATFPVDSVVLFGDRYEMLVAATMFSQFSSIQIIHYGAGQTSLGSKDNVYRNCISLLSSKFIVSTYKSLSAVHYLKQDTDSLDICVSGSLGLDRISCFDRSLFPIRPRFILISIHPQQDNNNMLIYMLELVLLECTKQLSSNLEIKISRINNDLQGEQFYALIKEMFSRIGLNYTFLADISDDEYLGCMSEAELLIGNSSSFVIEAPSLRKSTILLGNRQEGRESAKSVLRIGTNQNRIKRLVAFSKYLNSNPDAPDHYFANPYWNGGASKAIVNYLYKISR